MDEWRRGRKCGVRGSLLLSPAVDPHELEAPPVGRGVCNPLFPFHDRSHACWGSAWRGEQRRCCETLQGQTPSRCYLGAPSLLAATHHLPVPPASWVSREAASLVGSLWVVSWAGSRPVVFSGCVREATLDPGGDEDDSAGTCGRPGGTGNEVSALGHKSQTTTV